MPHTIHTGDALATLRELPSNTYDAMLTDPPYGIAFMGKEWDKGVPSTDVWREALRVLKPGAHALVACGTRTQHRMVTNLENAGFEVRDVIAYLYGSGFPKSKAVGCRCGRMDTDGDTDAKAEHAMPSVRSTDVSAPEGTTRGQGPLLQSGVPEPRSPATGRSELPATEVRIGQPRVEGRHHLQAEQGQLHRAEVRAVPEGVSADGPSGRVRDGTPACDGEVARSVPVEVRGRASQESRDAGQPPVEPGAVREQRRAQAGRVGEEACPDCGGLKAWHGYGTALKPAMELWTLIRKPLDGTVANNALTHGTGALNIDGSRIGLGRENPPRGSGNPARNGVYSDFHGVASSVTPASGRWPANVIHDGSDEVLKGFPHTANSARPSSAGTVYEAKNQVLGKFAPHAHRSLHDDGGGSAARFFYTAKASRREREAGLDTMPPHTGVGTMKGDADGSLLTGSGNARNTTARNPHPTVKPLALTEYLARLLLPPERTDGTPRRILTPFSGVGSEMIGALKAGWDHATGIELDAEYVAIAHARIRHWIKDTAPLFAQAAD